uniref:Uncharacterized protein n=1 Tax=Amphiprion ocellaris TaxID=80972 RepID=A0A3Q1BMP6_AMPOC
DSRHPVPDAAKQPQNITEPPPCLQYHDTLLTFPMFFLEIFDNEEYDCRTPEDWLALGNAEGSPGRKPIPAKALLPADDETPSGEIPPLRCSWHVVGVLDYSKEKCQYLVQKVHQSTRQADENENPNKKHTKGMSPLVAGSKYWVPRIRLLFSAEDPLVFVERIQFALRYRENTEALIFYQLSVDCMPIWPGAPSLSTVSLEHMKRLALSAPGLSLEKCIEDLEKEIKLEYDRTMNSMIFEKVVMSHPEEFPHITLPQKDSECVPQTGRTIGLVHICLHLSCSMWSHVHNLSPDLFFLSRLRSSSSF